MKHKPLFLFSVLLPGSVVLNNVPQNPKLVCAEQKQSAAWKLLVNIL